MICSFECTFCQDCTKNILHNICPNCGGGLERRPIRPKEKLLNNPAQASISPKSYDPKKHAEFIKKYQNILPENR